jgi:serine/threonine protein kinase
MAYHNLKPSNLLIFHDGYVKLADIDILKSRRTIEDKKKFINYNYRAPEINFGFEGDPLSDLWALGVLAYQISNLMLPFDPNSLSSNRQYFNRVVESE